LWAHRLASPVRSRTQSHHSRCLAPAGGVGGADIPMTSLSTHTMVVSDMEMRSGNSGSKFKAGDTLFARITPCLENGKTAYVGFLSDDQVGFGSTEFIVMRGRTVSPEWVYLFARSEQFRGHAIKTMSGATGRQ